MNPPKERPASDDAQRLRKRPIDPSMARRNRRTAGLLVLLALAFLAAFLRNFGVFG
jgi:hypothetical protein